MYDYNDESADVSDGTPQFLMGITKSHTAKFREHRSEKMDSYNTDINKLVIRLERLMNGLTADPVKRKNHEQTVVQWMDDMLVDLCPSCGSNFNLTRRKHHCRLCGAISCKACSQFLSIQDAIKLLNRKQVDGAGQQTSLPDFRVCIPCSERLEHKRQKVASKSARPIICQYYDKLQLLQLDASTLLLEYHKMHSSLCSGESMYDLRSAQMTRLKIVQLAEQIEQTSKSILILGTKSNEESAPRGRVLRLQQSIRSSASNFIRDKLMCLPNLPSEVELKAMQERLQSGLSSRMSKQAGGQKAAHVMQGAGWGAFTAVAPSVEADDPIVQQINNVKGFIKQAREAGKHDEVRMLEENLRMLETTFWQQQGQ